MAKIGRKAANTPEKSADGKGVEGVSKTEANRRQGRRNRAEHRRELIIEVLDSFGSLGEPAKRSIMERLCANL